MRRAFGHLFIGAACWLAAATGASAQTITAGVKAGVVLSSMPNAGQVVDQVSDTQSIDVSAKFGVTGGGFVQFAFTDRFSFQPEMLFVMKGVKLDLVDNTGTATASINYLEFPLLARITAPISDQLRAYILVGPAFAVKWSTKAEVDLGGEHFDVNEDFDPAIGSRDFSMVVGGGLERDAYLIEARYTFGLIDVPTGIYVHDDSLRNRAFSVMVGLRIP
jgi:outer membrane protein with beta-barrel domain